MAGKEEVAGKENEGGKNQEAVVSQKTRERFPEGKGN